MKIGNPGVRIGEYGKGESLDSQIPKDNNAVVGWIEPDCISPQWILWFTNRGDAIFPRKRAVDGAVEDEPITVKGRAEILANIEES